MSNIQQDWKFGTPGVGISKWPKGTVVKTDVVRNDEGRFIARVKVNGDEFFSLPGSHPTEVDAQITLDAYVGENSQ